MDDKTRSYIIEVLSALGQMDHIHKKDFPPGIMTMNTKTRSALIAKGWWEILDQTTVKR